MKDILQIECGDNMNKNLINRLHAATVASCTCMTKTPDIAFHAINCMYRVLVEAVAEITRLNKRVQVADELADTHMKLIEEGRCEIERWKREVK